MAEEMPVSSGRIEANLSEKVSGEERQVRRNGDAEFPASEINKEDEEESSLDEEFIKVEKEISADVVESSNLLNPMVEAQKSPDTVNCESGDPEANDNFGKMKDRIKELELQLETIQRELRSSDAGNASLKSEFNLVNKELEEIDKHCKELESEQKLMKTQILESEHRYNLQFESLQEAQKASDAKDKELDGARESFTRLSMELNDSRERIKGLEEDLSSSVDDLHKLIELNKQCTSEVDAESIKVFDLEKALELAHANEKEMEDQISNLQKELKELYGEIAEKHRVEEALHSASTKLSKSNEYLEISISQVAELEQKLASKDAFIYKLTEELNLYKFSQDQLQEEVAKLENLLSASKEDSDTKLVEELELKFQEQKEERETVEVHFKNQEVEIESLRRNLSDLNKEKVMWESTVKDLQTKLLDSEELHSQLRAKINLADKEFEKTNSLLSLALSSEVAKSRTLELEGLFQGSLTAEESSRTQVKESDMRLALSEKRIIELEQQLNLSGLKCLDAENEIKEQNEKILELTSSLKELNGETSLLRQRFKNYEDRIDQLEFSLSNSSLRNSELEKEINDLLKTCVEHEEQSTATHYHTLELEDLIHSSRSKAEDAESRAKGLELLLESANSRIQELEQFKNQIQILENELKSLREKTESSQEELAASSVREKDLLEKLRYSGEQLEHQEKALEETTARNLELSSLHESLVKDSELRVQDAITSFKQKESEAKQLLERLDSLEEQLEFYKKQSLEATENATLIEAELRSNSMKQESLENNVEDLKKKVSKANQRVEETLAENELLVTLNSKLSDELEAHKQKVNECKELLKSIQDEKDAIAKENESQLSEAIERHKQRDLEARQLHEELHALRSQLSNYEEQANESAVVAATQRSRLEEAYLKVQDLQCVLEQLKHESDQLKSENEGLARHNLNLSEKLTNSEIKMDELKVALDAAVAEKEDLFMKLHSSRKETENLIHLLNADNERLQLQVTSLMEDKNLHNEAYQKEKHEYEATIAVIEGSLSEHKERELSLSYLVENLKADAYEKSLMESQISELEQQLEHQTKAVEEVTARNLELNSLNEYLVKDSELKLQESAENLKQKEFEACELLGKFNSLEEQLVLYKDQALEATENVTSLKEELAMNAMKYGSLENTIHELEQKLLEANLRGEWTIAENEELATSNSKFKDDLEAHQNKVNELNELLQSIYSEKQVTAEQVASHTSTIAMLTEERSRGLDLQSAIESRLREKEAQLHETLEKHKQRDLEANELNEKLLALETQLKTNEIQSSDSAVVAATHMEKLEEALLKIQDLEELVSKLESKLDQFKSENESLARNNVSLSEEIATYDTKVNELQVAFDAVVAEKEDASMKRHRSKQELEDRIQLLYSDKDKLQSQINIITGEKNVLIEMHIKEKNEYVRTIGKLEKNLREQLDMKASLDSLVESLEAELSKKSSVQAEMEEHLEHHRQTAEEITARHLDLNLLNESLVKDSELKLQEAAASFKQKEIEAEELLEKAKLLEEQLTFYKEQTADANENVALLKIEAEMNAMKLSSLENSVDDLKQMVSEANLRAEQTLAENELLVAINSKIKEDLESNERKVNELNELLKSIHAEKEDVVSRSLEVQSVTEARLRENEVQLHESIETLKLRDLESRELNEKLSSLENKMKNVEKQASESAAIAANKNRELEEAVFRMQDLEELVGQLKTESGQLKNENDRLTSNNLSLSEQLAVCEAKINDLQEEFEAAIAEKENLSMQINCSKKDKEDLLQMLNSDKDKLQLQMTSIMEEKDILERKYQSSMKELEETIAQFELKKNEKKEAEFSVNIIMENLKAELSEKSVMQADLEQKLRFSEEQLEHLQKALDDVSAKNVELNSLNENLVKDSELKLKEAAEGFKQKESEAKELLEKLISFEEKMDFYKEQAQDAAQNVTSLEAELEVHAMKLASYEKHVEELKKMHSETNLRSDHFLAENQLLTKSNSKLNEDLEAHQHKVNELNELLQSLSVEKEATMEQLASHAITIAKLTDDHSRALELQSATESRLKKYETQLHEATEKHKQRDSKATELHEKLLMLETQLRTHEQRASESAADVAIHKCNLKEAAHKIQDLGELIGKLKSEIEGLTIHNLSLSDELASYKTKINELQVAFDAVVAEKEDLVILFKSDKEKLQLEVTSLLEEKIMLNEMYQNAREELKAATIESEEKLKEHETKEFSLISLMENLKKELSEKCIFLEELEQKLRYSEEQLENQRKAIAESTAWNVELNALIKDLELKLQEEVERFKQKELEGRYFLEKLDSQEEQLKFYEEQAQEATEKATSLQAELAAKAMKLVYLENNIEELRRNVSEANIRCEQALAENKMLATSKSELILELEARQDKVNQLNETLKSIHDEKEATIEKLTLHVSKLTEEHSRGLELHSVTESLLKENQAQLHNATEKHKQRDIEATELHKKMLELQTLSIKHENQANETAVVAATQKAKLEEAMLKIQEMEALVEQLKIHNESLTRHNVTLSEELLTYETKINELQATFDAVIREKEDISINFFSSKKEMEDVIQLLESDKHKLQSQVTLIMEENIMLNERYKDVTKELEATTLQLEEKISEHKEKEFSLEYLVESLRAELTEKSLMHDEFLQKLSYAEEQVEHKRKYVSELTARNLELNLLNESLIKDSELKLQEATDGFKQKESEVRELLERLNSLEEQLTVYKEQTLEASEKFASFEAELAANAMKIVSLENNVEELKQEVSVANLKGEQILVENELLGSLNSNLNEELSAHLQKVNELNDLLKSVHAEKEATAEQLSSHANTIASLTEEHCKELELHSTTQSLLKEKETHLHEAIEKIKRRDLDATELNEKLLALGSELTNFEKQASELAALAATEKGKFEEATSKVQNLERIVEQLEAKCHQFKNENEGLTRQNVSFSEFLANYEAKTNKLQEDLDVALIEKEDKSMQFYSSKKEMEDLIQVLKSEKDELHAQVSLIKEENIMSDERYEKARKQLETTIVQLEGKLSEHEARDFFLESLVESLKEELAEKSLMHEELEQKLRYAEDQVEHHKNSVAEFTAKNLELKSSNEYLIKNSEMKILKAAESFKQKETESIQLLQKLHSLEEQLTFYKEHALEAAENVASLEAELAANATKVISLENNVEDLKQQVAETNLSSAKILSENELLATSNSKLNDELDAHQQKVNELTELLQSIHAEKEAAVEQLNYHVNALTKLTEEHTTRLELHSTTQSLLEEKEAHLREAIEKLKQRDLSATEVNEKLLALESELRNFEKQASELAALAATEKGKFEEAASRVHNLEQFVEQLKTECLQLKNENEDLTKHNLSLSEDLVACESKTNELQEAIDVAVKDKEDISMQFCSLKKGMEDVIQHLESDKYELQKQVTLFREENIMMEERFKKARAEFESIIVQLEEKVSEQKGREFSLGSLLESLRAELTEKSHMYEEVEQKLCYAEEQVEHHKKSISEITSRNFELNSLNESLLKDSELQLKEAVENFKLKEYELIQMIEKLNSLEEQLMFHKEQTLEASKNVASLDAELAAKDIKVVFLENTVEELKQQVSDANLKTEQTLAENELLSLSNSKLIGELEAHDHKVNELNDMLRSINDEKQANAEQLMSHANTIAKLSEEHSRGLELHSTTASLLKENEEKLQETIEKLGQKDLEARELHQKLLALDTQLITSEKLANDFAVLVSTEKEKLEEAVSKIHDLEELVGRLKNESHQFKTENEGLTTHNLSLSEKLENYGTKINELQVAFSAVVTEKEDISMQFNSSKKGMEDLIELLKTDKVELQSQVSLVMEENIIGNERYERTRKEHESTIVQLEEKLREQKAREFTVNSLVECLQAELTEKSIMLEELVQRLRYAEEQVEHHSNSVSEFATRNLELSSFNESLVKNSELKLQEAAESLKIKDSEVIQLLEKLTSLEKQLTYYKEQTVVATVNVASLEADLAENAMKVVSLESEIEELRKQVFEANLKGEITLAEKEQLALSNLELKDELESFHHGVDELNGLLKSLHAEKESALEQLASHSDTIAKLTVEHSRGLELHSVIESSLRQNEAELQKSVKELENKDLEARELSETFLALETQLRTYKKQASESAIVAETQNEKLEEALSKIQDLEALVEQLKTKSDQARKENEGLTRDILILSEELATYNTKIIKLQSALDTAVTDKEKISLQFRSSTKQMDDLMQILKSDKENLQSEVASVMEENIMLNNMYHKSRNDLEATLVQLEEKLSEQKAREFSLNSVVESLQEELSEKSIFQEELGQNLRCAEEQLEHLRKSLEEVNAENMKLNSLNESLVNDSEVKLQEATENLKKKEYKANELFEKLNFLEEQLAFYKEQATEASERSISFEAELEENAMKLASVEHFVQELKQKNLEINLRSEKSHAECELLAASNSKLEEEQVAHLHRINELNDLLKSIHDEKEAAVEQLSSYATEMAKLTDQQSRGLELQFETESRLKENKAKLHDAIEKYNHKDLETRELQEKLHQLESKLIMYEELASESALVAATRKGKLEEAAFRIQDLEALVGQLQSMLEQLKTENKDLTKHNHRLSEELMANETKMHELRVAFNAAITDKEDILMRIHSSNQEMEDILQIFNSDNEKLQSQIASAMEEKNLVDAMFNKARKELEETIAQLEEKLQKQKAREFSLSSLVENLKSELSEKYLMQAQISELEQKMFLAEETYAQEIESMALAVAEKDEVLTAKLMEHTILVKERNALDHQLKEILKELDSAQRIIMEQKKLESAREFKRQASMEQSRDALEFQNQRVTLLEKQVEELKKTLRDTKTQYKEKVIKEAKKIRLLTAELNELKLQLSKATEMEIKIIKLENALQLSSAAEAQELKNETSPAESKVEMGMKSRDLRLDTIRIAERKIKNKSNRVQLDTKRADERQTVTVDMEPSVAMAFKFLLGIAVVSMVLGLILGKRY